MCSWRMRERKKRKIESACATVPAFVLPFVRECLRPIQTVRILSFLARSWRHERPAPEPILAVPWKCFTEFGPNQPQSLALKTRDFERAPNGGSCKRDEKKKNGEGMSLGLASRRRLKKDLLCRSFRSSEMRFMQHFRPREEVSLHFACNYRCCMILVQKENCYHVSLEGKITLLVEIQFSCIFFLCCCCCCFR